MRQSRADHEADAVLCALHMSHQTHGSSYVGEEAMELMTDRQDADAVEFLERCHDACGASFGYAREARRGALSRTS